MHRLLSVAALATALTACGPAAPLEPAEPVDTKAAGQREEPAQVAQDPREAMLKATLERARVIQDEVAALRTLAFNHPVPAERQTTAEFRRVLIEEIAKVFPAEKSRRTSLGLFHIGVLRERMDLATAAIEIAAGQVAAYYNPETGKFYAVSLSNDQAWLDIMTAHELVHGLQDQHFDLRHYVGEPSPKHPEKVELTEDQMNARRFVVEGEASFLMWMYQASKSQKTEFATDPVVAQARAVVAMTAAVSWQSMVKQADAEARKSKTKKAAELSKMPPFLVAPTLSSYTTGAKAVATVHAAGGWKAVSDLYSNPPDSTEQVLHPREKLVDGRDMPTGIKLPDLSKRFGKPLISETLGELGWRVYLQTWEIPAAEVAAAGWDGDRLAVYETKEGLVGLIAFVMDSEDDAIELENALRRSFRARTNTGTDATDRKTSRYPRSKTSEIVIARDGAKLFVVDGAVGKRADSFMTTLRDGTTFK